MSTQHIRQQFVLCHLASYAQTGWQWPAGRPSETTVCPLDALPVNGWTGGACALHAWQVLGLRCHSYAAQQQQLLQQPNVQVGGQRIDGQWISDPRHFETR